MNAIVIVLRKKRIAKHIGLDIQYFRQRRTQNLEIPEAVVNALDSIGFVWDNSSKVGNRDDIEWMKMYKAYKQKYDNGIVVSE